MLFFLQMVVILAACRACGWVVRRFFRQPEVVGEMIAGVILGPSLLGAIAPSAQQFLFPQQSRPLLSAMAQLGIAVYMFVVGLDFRGADFRAHAKGAVAVSLVGIAVPFLVAILATPWLLSTPGLFATGVSRFNATLFLGSAIAITAFPVLARIIRDRNLQGTRIATQALSAAAIGDAVAWCVVAAVLVSLGAGTRLVYLAVGGGIALTGVLLLLGPRLFAPLGALAERQHAPGEPLTPGLLALSLALCMLAACVSDAIGLHAVFGAFLLGTAMPRGAYAQRIRQTLEPFTLAFLLPVFFVFSGLNTQLTLVSTPALVGMALALLALSIFAKFVACWAAALASGQDNAGALGLGALMNARGLTELIILNIGLQAGVIGPALFSMLVSMAIVTTLMASPLFEQVYGKRARAAGEIPPLR